MPMRFHMLVLHFFMPFTTLQFQFLSVSDDEARIFVEDHTLLLMTQEWALLGVKNITKQRKNY